eukprot:g6883.t1
MKVRQANQDNYFEKSMKVLEEERHANWCTCKQHLPEEYSEAETTVPTLRVSTGLVPCAGNFVPPFLLVFQKIFVPLQRQIAHSARQIRSTRLWEQSACSFSYHFSHYTDEK